MSDRVQLIGDVLGSILSGDDIDLHFDRVTLKLGEERDTAGEIHVLLKGALRVRLEAPLRGVVQWDARPLDCFGGSGLLSGQVLTQAPELQLLQGRMRASTGAELLTLPLHVAQREPSLRRFVGYALGSMIARMNGPDIHRGLRRIDALRGSARASLSELLGAGRVVYVEGGDPALAVPRGGAAVLLAGEIAPAQTPEAALSRFEVAAGGAELLSASRAMLLLLEDLAVAGATDTSDLALLTRSHLWSGAPPSLERDGLFQARVFEPGEVLSNTTSEGLPGDDSALEGALFFLLEGSARLSTRSSAAARGVRRREWAGGEAWLGSGGRALPGRSPGSRIVASARVRALVAAPTAETSDWVRGALRALVESRILLESNRLALADAMAQIPNLAGIQPSMLGALVSEGDMLYLKRGTRIRPPAGELFIPLQANLEVTPLGAERRFIPTPAAYAPLGATEFFNNQRPEVAWVARRACWLFRITRGSYQDFRDKHRGRLPPLESQSGGFDRAGGAEIMLVDAHASADAERALPVLADLLAQSVVRQFGDLVLVVRVGLAEGSEAPIPEEGTQGQPDRVSLKVPRDGVAAALTPKLREWNEDYTSILLVAPDRGDEGRLVREALAGFAERLVFLTRDPTATSGLALPVDCAVHCAVLLPQAAWPSFVAETQPDWAPGGQHPGFPQGAVRLRLEPADYRTPRDLEQIPEQDRARFDRWARCVSDRLLGVALGGGGAYGFVHVALLMELERLGLPLDVISGASVGATVGAVYTAAGAAGLQELIRLSGYLERTTQYNMFSMRFMSGYVDTMLTHLAQTSGSLEHPSEQPLVDGHWPVVSSAMASRVRSIRARLKDELTWSPGAMLQLTRTRDDPRWTHYRYLQDFEVPFYPVAADLETGCEVVLEVGALAEGVRASGSFPGASPPSPHPSDPERKLIDGGFAGNVPDAVLIRQGVGLVVASNPIPPPSATPHGGRSEGLDVLKHPSEWPLLRRGFQIYRASHILLHTVGERSRGTSYQAPVSEYGLMDLGKAEAIARLPYEQEEFREALQEIQQSWARISAPRRPARLMMRRREVEWADLATTGWAVVFPVGTTQDDPRYQALRPLIRHRREAVRAGGAASRLQVFMGGKGYKPGQSVEQFIEAAGGTPGEVLPKKLGYHVLLVGGPEEIPFDFQIGLDLDYAVGRLSFDEDEPARLAVYVRRVIAAETSGVRSPRRVDIAYLSGDDPMAAELREQFMPAMRGALKRRNPEWEQHDLDHVSGTGAADSARSIFSPGDSDLLVVTGSTWMPLEPLEERDYDRIGWPLIEGALAPMEAVTGAPSPRVVVMFGAFSGGADVRSRYDFLAAPPPLHYPERALVSVFVQGLLAAEHGPLAVVAKLDMAWMVPPFKGRQAETRAVVETLEMLMRGRTVGAAMQITSDFYQGQQHLVSKAERLGRSGDSALIERLKLGVENAKSWLLLGDPAVRLNP